MLPNTKIKIFILIPFVVFVVVHTTLSKSNSLSWGFFSRIVSFVGKDKDLFSVSIEDEMTTFSSIATCPWQ